MLDRIIVFLPFLSKTVSVPSVSVPKVLSQVRSGYLLLICQTSELSLDFHALLQLCIDNKISVNLSESETSTNLICFNIKQ